MAKNLEFELLPNGIVASKQEFQKSLESMLHLGRTIPPPIQSSCFLRSLSQTFSDLHEA